MRIVLVVSSLRNGGAERVVVNLATGLAARGHDVNVLTYRWDREDFFFVPDSVKRAHFRLEGSGREKIRRLRKALQELSPDVVISHMNKTNVRTLLASRKAPWKVLVTEHNDPRQQPIEWNWSLLRHWVYRKADSVVGVSHGVVDAFPLVSRSRKVVIPNGVLPHSFLRTGPRTFKIVAVGRLFRIKGFDLLVDAFHLVHETAPAWKLEIWGEGDERARLENQIRENGMEGVVSLPGTTAEPLAKMAGAAMLVCSSRSEGFGNVLVEAMSVGIPVVSFDCPCGPREIVEHEKNGLLVPPEDVPLLARAILRLIQDEALWGALAAGALASSAKFSNDAILDAWERRFQ